MEILQDHFEKDTDGHFPLDDIFSFDIRPYTDIVRFQPDELILEEGMQCRSLLYLLDGRAKLFLTHENGRISLVNYLAAPCFIGEMEMINAQENASGVKAITVCVCYRIDLDRCRERILNDNRFLRYLCMFLGRKALANTDHYSKNQSASLNVRLARFILETERGGYYRERHTETAEYLGVTYRHLLYVLAEFVREGILEKTPAGYRICDADLLRKIIRE